MFAPRSAKRHLTLRVSKKNKMGNPAGSGKVQVTRRGAVSASGRGEAGPGGLFPVKPRPRTASAGLPGHGGLRPRAHPPHRFRPQTSLQSLSPAPRSRVHPAGGQAAAPGVDAWPSRPSRPGSRGVCPTTRSHVSPAQGPRSLQ